LITKLYDELDAYRGEIDNFASFLRVCCLRYMSLMVDGAISSDKLPLASANLDTAFIGNNNGTKQALMQS
jgi:predicted DNA-binding ribbon-helix-helix protein